MPEAFDQQCSKYLEIQIILYSSKHEPYKNYNSTMKEFFHALVIQKPSSQFFQN